jgi:hypothetical protein
VKNQNSKEFSGIIIDKKFYEWDRGKKILKIKNESRIDQFFFPTGYEYDDFWEEIQIGDSIFKAENDKIFSIYKNEIFFRRNVLDFNCEE